MGNTGYLISSQVRKEAATCSLGMGRLTGQETSNYRELTERWAWQRCRKGAGVGSKGSAGGMGTEEGRSL